MNLLDRTFRRRADVGRLIQEDVGANAKDGGKPDLSVVVILILFCAEFRFFHLLAKIL